MWDGHGDVNELGDADRGPGKSFLFCLTCVINVMTLKADKLAKGLLTWKSDLILRLSGALFAAHENPREKSTVANSDSGHLCIWSYS